MIKKLFLYLLFGLGVLVLILLYNTLTFESKQKTFEPINALAVEKRAINNLADAIKIPTISTENSEGFDSVAFNTFVDFLANRFPLVDSLLEKQIINQYSFLYRWKGTSADLKPAILMGHLDVVPVEENSLSLWENKPFAGTIANGVLWGRGTLDDKCNVIGVLEAVNALLKEGYKPQRTLYLAFGHDEEVGGEQGAKKIATYLHEKGVRADFVLDEGLAITENMVPGISPPVALIGIAEKGFMTLKLTVNAAGGHSSMPEKETAISILSKSLLALNDNPLPGKISLPVMSFMNFIGPEMPFLQRIFFANVWLFEPIILKIYEKTGSGSALIRTTTAPTIIKGGIKENVIPTEVQALVNFRILSGESSQKVIAQVVKLIDDARVVVTVEGKVDEPSGISGINTLGFNCISRTIKQIYPKALVTPSLVLGITDSRHFEAIADHVYRFSPITITPENKAAIHGINECIPVVDFENTVKFYHQLIKNIDVLSISQ